MGTRGLEGFSPLVVVFVAPRAFLVFAFLVFFDFDHGKLRAAKNQTWDVLILWLCHFRCNDQFFAKSTLAVALLICTI